MKKESTDANDKNHPAAFLGGGAAGAAAGAAVGSLAGPVGTAVGAVVGGVAAAKTSEAIAAGYDESTYGQNYWKENYSKRPYVTPDSAFDDYSPAYRAGFDASSEVDDGSSFDDVEDEVRTSYESSPKSLEWNNAKNAARDAFDKMMEQRTEQTRLKKTHL